MAHFPDSVVNRVKVEASGNIYVAGYGIAAGFACFDAFVAKLSPDGSKILYVVTFAGSSYEYATALDVDSTGAAYVSGRTGSRDFPVTSGALQTAVPGSRR